jgi:hypothetical protein
MRVARARYGQPWRVVGQRLQRPMTNGKLLAGGPAGTGAMAAEKLQQRPSKRSNGRLISGNEEEWRWAVEFLFGRSGRLRHAKARQEAAMLQLPAAK